MLPTPEQPRSPDVRVSDADRGRFVSLLRDHCTDGRLTLDEFSDRVGAVYAARTRSELDRVVDDLQLDPAPATGGYQRPDTSSWRALRPLVAVFGSSVRRGRFRLGERTVIAACFGSCRLDLSDAVIESPEVTVIAVSMFGDVTVEVPEGIRVEVEGIAVFGEKRSKVTSEPPAGGSPVVVVQAVAAFGSVTVRHPRRRVREVPDQR